jgi:integrase
MNGTEKLPRGVFERPPGSGTYWIRYADANRRERKEKAGRLKFAIDLYRKRKTEALEGRKIPQANRRDLRFDELAADYLEFSRVRHTPQTYEKNIQRMAKLLKEFRGRSAEQIGAQELTRFLGKDDWAPATRNRYRALGSALYSLGIRHDKLELNPWRKVRLWRENNSRVRFLEPREEKKLRASVRIHAPANEPEFDLALNTGLRRGEQWKLRWTDVDWTRKILTVTNSKNGESRHIPLNGAAVDALRKLRDVAADCPYVVNGPEDPAQRVSDNRRWFDICLRRSRVRDFHWHDLRHTFASRLVMGGTDIRTVQDLMGHKVIAMTVRYSHLSAPHKREAVGVLDKYKAQPEPQPPGEKSGNTAGKGKNS